MENAPKIYDERDLTVYREPKQVLEEAHIAAAALHDVISKKPKKVMMNGEQYLEFEDWQTIGKFYGVTVKVVSTNPVTFGDVRGFEAKAVVINVKTGAEVSAADAMCLNDEENWGKRPKYEWHYICKNGVVQKDDPGKDQIIWENKKPKKKRVQVQDEQVPLFQLRSMAQTRACAKALRNVLAWVVVLAGYKPTPAEEMQGIAEVVDAEVIEEGKEIKKTSAPEKGTLSDPDLPAPEEEQQALKDAGMIPGEGEPIGDPLAKYKADLTNCKTKREVNKTFKEFVAVTHPKEVMEEATNLANEAHKKAA